MKPVYCCNCEAEATTKTYFELGWIQAKLSMKDGTKQIHYTCDKCRNDSAFSLFTHAGAVTTGKATCRNNPPQAL